MSSPPSPDAWDLVSTAFGRALDEVIATGGPLPPVVLHRTDAGTDVRRFEGASIEESLAAAREQLAEDDALPWVLVWDGYLTIEDWRTDALYAHLEVKDEAIAHLFAWRYGRVDGGTVGPLEPAVYLGPDARYRDPGRSHPLPPGEGPTAPHGEVLPPRRWWNRRR